MPFFPLMVLMKKPFVLVKLYKSVVLPTVLYGYEMWNHFKSVDLTYLNTFQQFIVKRIQNLKDLTCVKGYLESIFLHPTLTLENCYFYRNYVL